jgi:hypothetical protein
MSPDPWVRWDDDLLEEAPEGGPKRAGCLITRTDPTRAPEERPPGNGDRTLTSTRAFESVQVPLLEVIHLLSTVERWMESLKESFNDAMPPSLLRLRPWPRTKGGPPYALYWIFFQRCRPRYDEWTFRLVEDRKPRRFRRLKIRTRADLSTYVHLARLNTHREGVYRYHDRAQALNEAHRVLARALDSVRKMVNGRAAECWTSNEISPLDGSRFLDVPRRHLAWIEQLWRIGWTMRGLSDDMRQFTENRRQSFPRQRYKLVYQEDSDHPYGRLIWRDELSRASFSSMPDRLRRKLRIPRSDFIADAEALRRTYTKRLQTYAKLMKRIRLKLGHALKVGRAAFDRARSPGAIPYREVP